MVLQFNSCKHTKSAFVLSSIPLIELFLLFNDLQLTDSKVRFSSIILFLDTSSFFLLRGLKISLALLLNSSCLLSHILTLSATDSTF